MKRVILCADDYAQSATISTAILRLVEVGRLSATSVLSGAPHWPDAAQGLRPFKDQIDIGLHFNLTLPYTASARPLSYWLLLSQIHALPRAALCDAALRQIDCFADVMGCLPDYIDGHEHVHALPVIRGALTEAIRLRWPADAKPYVRRPDGLGHHGDSPFKGWILRQVTRGFSAHVKLQHLVGPAWFGGLYSLSAESNYVALMQTWLAECPDRGLIMCHPGGETEVIVDPIAPARQSEYRHLASDAFAEQLERNEVKLTRFMPNN